MMKIFVVLGVIGLALFYYASVRNAEAMAMCQAKGFSYDVCFDSLNN